MTQHQPTTRTLPRSLVLPFIGVFALASCATGGGGADDGGSAQSFSFAFPSANDDDDAYIKLAEAYTAETGVEIELLPIPTDGYSTQLPVQLQGGNAADLMQVYPGSGLPTSVLVLAEAGLLEPLADSAASVIPAGTESRYTFDGEVYAQPTSLGVSGVVWNAAAAKAAGIDEYPTTFEETLQACATARAAGLDYMVLAGSALNSLGRTAQTLSATRVYAATPDWNEKRAAGDVTFAGSAWAHVLEDILAMKDAGCFQPGAEGSGFDVMTAKLTSGEALTASLPGDAAQGLSSGDVTLTIQPMAPRQGGRPWIIASADFAFGMNAASDDATKAAVADFLAWAAVPENAVIFANIAGAIPIVGADTTDVLPPYVHVADMIAEGSFSALPNSGWPNASVYEALSSGVQGLLTGQLTIPEVLAAMDAAWEG